MAAGKVRSLIACGARVRVVAPTLTKALRRLWKQRKIRWHKRLLKPQDLAGIELVVAATSDPRLHPQVVRWARRRGIWVNVVDEPALCSFIVPAVVRRGPLVLAISTGGASPALAAWIRRDLEARYGHPYAQLLKQAARLRGRVKAQVADPSRRKRLYEAALKAYFNTLRKGGE